MIGVIERENGLKLVHGIGLLAWLGVAALVVRARCDSLLQTTHLPGERAYDLPLVATPSTIERIGDAVMAWKSLGPEVPGVDIAVGAIAADVLATVCLLAAATLALGAVGRYLRPEGGEGVGDAERRAVGLAAQRARWLALGALALRVAGDLITGGLILAADGDKEPASPPALVGGLIAGLQVTGAAMAAAALGILTVAAVWAAAARRADGDSVRRDVVTVRVHCAVVAFFGVLVLAPVIGPQLDDVILRWEQEEWDAVVAVVAMLWLGIVLLTVTDHLLANDRVPQRDTTPGRLIGVGLALVLMGCLLVRGLLVLGGILVVLGLLSVGIGRIDPRRRAGMAVLREPVQNSLVPVVLAVGPIAMLGIAVVRAFSGEAALGGGGWGFVAAGILVPPIICVLTRWKPLRRGLLPVVVVSSVLALVIGAGLVVNPWRWGDLLGVVGTFATFAVILSLLGFALAATDLRWRPPPILLVLGQRRLPILAVLLLWGLGVGLLLSEQGYHDIRTEPLRGGTPPRVDVKTAWAEWLKRNDLKPARAGGTPRPVRRGIPLVVVAASGGGIRAAYWTARVVDCAIDHSAAPGCEGGRRNARRVFVASGISGGSVGLASWAAHRVSGDRAPGTVWVDKRLGEDYFAPAWARTLFSDLPASLLRIGGRPDRGTVLERAWEQSWTPRATDLRSLFQGPQPSAGPLTERLLDLPRRVPDLPPLMFSGTSVTDGCRTITSRLRGEVLKEGADACTSTQPFAAGDGRTLSRRATFGATRDVFGVCPTKDLRLSTAALLSARFPIISPAARVACGKNDKPQIVDGGYFDNSAASPVQELWARLAPIVDAHNRAAKDHCVVPVLLQADNAYVSTAPPADARPREIFAPLTAVLKARSARQAGARQAAAIPFGTATLDDDSVPRAPGVGTPRSIPLERYVQVYPRVQPGAQAPLGWTLSQPSRESLSKEVRSKDNRAALAQVRRWFDPALRCTR